MNKILDKIIDLIEVAMDDFSLSKIFLHLLIVSLISIALAGGNWFLSILFVGIFNLVYWTVMGYKIQKKQKEKEEE